MLSAVAGGPSASLGDYGMRSRILTSIPNPVSQLIFHVQPSNVATNTNISPAVVVYAADGMGSPVAGFTGNITMSVHSGTGTLSGTLVVACVAGVATFNDLKLDTAGAFTLRASGAGHSVDSASFTVSGGAPTSPVLTNLAQWLRAEALGLADNDPINTFTDESGSGNDGTALAAAIYKAAIVNGKAVARADGTKDYSMTPGVTLNNSFSAFFVIKQTGDNCLLGGAAGTPQVRIGQSANKLSAFDGLTNPESSTLSVTQGNWSIVAFNCVAGVLTFYQNGSAFGTATYNSALPMSRIMSTANSIKFNGDWAESLLYTAGLSGGDLAINFAYLNGQYALY